MLYARIVDHDIDPAELLDRAAHHQLDLGRLRHVGIVVRGLDAKLLGHVGLQFGDGGSIAETVEHHVGAFCSQRARDAKADAGSRTGDQGSLAPK